MTTIMKKGSAPKQIDVLIVDDSPVFRRLLRELFERANSINIIGEAANGIEALDLILKRPPDVIIMDMEMPLMDGMTSLQHLMTHKPTPTIMVSSLTREGTARGFDAIKNGAVDFICKDSFFQKKTNGSFNQQLIYKVLCAAKVMVRKVEPVFTGQIDISQAESKPSDIIFCEECGARNIVGTAQKTRLDLMTCRKCGDLLEVSLINKYKRINCLTVIGSGLGGYRNLLQVIPQIPEDMNGAIVIVLHAKSAHVDAFTEYLGAVSRIKVQRMLEGISIEGGTCYLAPASDIVQVKPYSAHYTIRKTKPVSGFGSIDLFMESVSSLFKDKAAGFVLSGSESDGEKGIKAIKANNGFTMVLNSGNCLCKEMGENILRKCIVDRIVDEKDAAACIIDLHQAAGSNPLAA